MFGGNYSEKNSFYLDNYGFFAGTIFTTQLAIVNIFNCIFSNQTSTTAGIKYKRKILNFKIIKEELLA